MRVIPVHVVLQRRCLTAAGILFVVSLMVSLSSQWVGDFWEHAAVVRELSARPLNPGHPQLLLGSPHAFYSPYARLVATGARITGSGAIGALAAVRDAAMALPPQRGVLFRGRGRHYLSHSPAMPGSADKEQTFPEATTLVTRARTHRAPPRTDPPAEQDRDHFVIEPSRGWSPLRLGELWDYRELLFFLVWRDLKSRYKQTSLGVAWAILQPVLTMVVFSVFFGRLAGVPSDGAPYPIFTFAALLPWQLFSYALTESGNSLVTNQELVTKVYFPRLLIPLSTVLGGVADFSIAFVVLIAMMVFYGVVPTAAVVVLPLLAALACATALAVGLWLAALNVQYRDVRYTLPFLTQFWLLATPIAYPASLVPDEWRILYSLNPMVGVVEGFRWALLGTGTGTGYSVLVSVLVVAALLTGGLMYFRRMERTFADIV